MLSADDCLAIRTIHSAWLDAELRGDSSALLQFCTPMTVWLPPNEPPRCGKAAILLWLACKLASFRTMIESPADEGPAVVTGTHAWLLQRDAAGAWRIGFVTWTITGTAVAK